MSKAVVHNSRFFKADQRTENSSDTCGIYSSVSQELSIDDIFLMPGSELMMASQKSPYLLLPLVGSIVMKHNDLETELQPEEAFVLKDGPLSITNMETTQTVNFLKITFHHSNNLQQQQQQQQGQLSLSRKNELLPFSSLNQHISVGVYDSRTKDTYCVHQDAVGICVFVVNGSFEVEDRLAEHRDKLLFVNTREISFEALSETAILLIIEF